MADNDLKNVPGAPLPPWGPKQPLDHKRLNRMQSEPVYDVKIVGPLVRKVSRIGGTITVLLGDATGATSLPLLHIQSAATGGGQYIVRKVTLPDTWDSTVDLAGANLGDDGTDDVLLINLQEVEAGTHWMTHADNTDQKYLYPDERWPMLDDAGREIYAVNAIWVQTCTPTPTPTPSPPP